MRRSNKSACAFLIILLCSSITTVAPLRADEIDAATQARIDAKVKEISVWAKSETLVSAVRERNSAGPGAYQQMNQEIWKTLSVLDPQVRWFTKNPVGQFLKSNKDAAVSEAFVSCADGTKVGFLTKPTYWCHAGKPKHDLPMKGQSWRGPVEVDESTGVQQLQIAVPILDGDKPIGSLVVGFELSKLKD